MKSGDLFKMVNDQIMQENIIPISEDALKTFGTYYSKLSFEELDLKFKKFKIPINNIKIVTNNIVQLWYMEDGVFIPIHGIEDNILSMIKVMDVAINRRARMKSLMGNESLMPYFRELYFASQEFLFFEFLRLYKQISEDEVYDIFRFCYTHVDYGFDRLPRSLIEELLVSKKNKPLSKPSKGFKKDDRGLVEVYRGVSKKSFDINKSNSWTTNLSVAANFASRFREMDGAIYTAYIKEEDIVDYIEDGGENEVILIPKDLIDMKIFEAYSFDVNFIQWLQDEWINLEYEEFQENFMIPEIFKSMKGIHGVGHTKRVLFLSMILAYKMDLEDPDRIALYLTAIFHDIGRTNDGRDIHHGKKAVEKWRKYKIPEMVKKSYPLNDDYILLIEKLIELHPYEDWLGESELKKIYNNDKAIKMYRIFKDADGLDRARFADVNTDMLRTDEAKKLILIAYQLVQNAL